MSSLLRRASRVVVNALKLRPEKKFVGKDLDGNTYHEVLPQRYFLGLLSISRHSRLVIPPGGSDLPKSVEIKVSKEWDAWLRQRREEPPTIEELVQNIEKYKVMQNRIEKLKEDDLKKQDHKTLSHFNENSATKESQTVDSWSGEK